MMAKLRDAAPNIFAAKLAMGNIDQAIYEDSMKRVLEELSALTPKNRHKLAV